VPGGRARAGRRRHEHGHALHRHERSAGAPERQGRHRRRQRAGHPPGDAPAARNTERVLRNAAVDRLLEKEKTLGAELKFEHIIDEVAGVYPKIMLEGAMDAGAWSCGMVAGLVHDIPTVKELIDRIMAEAEGIIGQRLARFAAAA
jgi:hypothetical protein